MVPPLGDLLCLPRSLTTCELGRFPWLSCRGCLFRDPPPVPSLPPAVSRCVRSTIVGMYLLAVPTTYIPNLFQGQQGLVRARPGLVMLRHARPGWPSVGGSFFFFTSRGGARGPNPGPAHREAPPASLAALAIRLGKTELFLARTKIVFPNPRPHQTWNTSPPWVHGAF